MRGSSFLPLLWLAVWVLLGAACSRDEPCVEGLSKTSDGNCAPWNQEGTGEGDADADSDTDSDTDPLYHPIGYSTASNHGPDAKLATEDCTACHGADLAGGSVEVSCDGCHDVGWRTNCIFCHGGTDNNTGAPPRDLSGATAEADLVFRAHTGHVEGTLHDGFDCGECHERPESATGDGHMFDGTPGVAEVLLGGGLDAAGTYDGAGSCSNSYCHENGTGDNGTWSHTQGAPGCGDCHPGPDSGLSAWQQMSTPHDYHLDVAGSVCSDCHGDTVAADGSIVGRTLHVNGTREVPIAALDHENGTCNGSCHSASGVPFLHEDHTWGPPPGGR